MTPEQMQVVRASWQLMEPQRDSLGPLFYEHLFALYPALRPMFKGDMTAQAAKLMATLNVVVNQLEDLSVLGPALRALGRRHGQEWQVLPEHYDAIAQALDKMLKQALGEQAGPELRAAWQAAYAQVADVMRAAAAAAAALAGS